MSKPSLSWSVQRATVAWTVHVDGKWVAAFHDKRHAEAFVEALGGYGDVIRVARRLWRRLWD